MQAFAQFASDLDKATQQQLARGERLTELLKQKQYQPLSIEKQILTIYAGSKGFVDKFPVASIKRYEQELFEFLDSKYPTVSSELLEKKKIDDELDGKIRAALEAFNKQFQP